MNSKRIGNITEMFVMLDILKLGYNVLTPYGDCERYDFVADIGGKFYRIQVKTSREKNGVFEFSTASTHYLDGKCVHDTYKEDEIDFIATVHDNKSYLIPINQCSTRASSLRFLPPKSGNQKSKH